MVNLKVAVAGVPGGWSSELLADRIDQQTSFRLLIDLAHLRVDFARHAAWYGDTNLCELDAIVVKKIGQEYSPDLLDRLALLRWIECHGVRIFSKPESMLGLIDRLSCTVTLQMAGIPMPETCITESLELAAETAREFGEAVFKPLYSTKARGMKVIAGNSPNLIAEVAAFRNAGNPVMYIQKKLDLPDRDYGLAFLGGEYVGAYARVKTTSSWNTTTKDGGKYALYQPSREIIELAQKAQAPFALDFTSVDVVETSDGPVVFEVSAFGGFRGLLEGCGLDAAALYGDYVLRRLTGG